MEVVVNKVKSKNNQTSLFVVPGNLILGTWIWYSTENRLFLSDGFCQLMGIARDVYPTFDLFVESIWADDLIGFVDAIEKILHDSKSRWIEFRISLPDKSFRTIRCYVEAMRSESADVFDIAGVCFDVSE
jgi:hypothetical protein